MSALVGHGGFSKWHDVKKTFFLDVLMKLVETVRVFVYIESLHTHRQISAVWLKPLHIPQYIGSRNATAKTICSSREERKI